MISNLKSFLKKNTINLDETKDSYTIAVNQEQLKPLFALLKEHDAMFMALVASPEAKGFKFNYIFYPQIQAKLLFVELRVIEPAVQSMTAYYPMLALYEQQIEQQCGIIFEGFHALKTPSHLPPEFTHAPRADEATIIPVGPIHAGVIEPGHFRFTAFGEHINKLEIKLGYKTRGVLTEFIGRKAEDCIELAEHICGDSTVAYSLAYTQALEKISAIEVDKKSLLLRTVLQELERLYNHIADIAGLVNDTGFAFGFARIAALKERVLRLNHKVWGHRFLRGCIKLGGLTKIPMPEQLGLLAKELQVISHDLDHLTALVRANNGVLERFKGTGFLSHAQARDLSVLGLVGRASGVSFDVRRDFPYAAYGLISFEVHGRKTGDVLARYNVRLSEIRESFHIIQTCLRELNHVASMPSLNLTKPTILESYSMAEAARGQVLAYVVVDEQMIIKHCIIRDISLHNWRALEHAVLHNIVADFPLCNKSFSLAYAGTDM